MKQGIPKTAAAARKEKLAKDTLLVKKAMELGFETRSQICEKTGLKMYELANILKGNEELYAEYCIRRKTLVDVANDNISDIVHDKEHPKHYEASKFIATKYRGDLDTILEPADASEIEIELGGASTASPCIVKFKTKNKED